MLYCIYVQLVLTRWFFSSAGHHHLLTYQVTTFTLSQDKTRFQPRISYLSQRRLWWGWPPSAIRELGKSLRGGVLTHKRLVIYASGTEQVLKLTEMMKQTVSPWRFMKRMQLSTTTGICCPELWGRKRRQRRRHRRDYKPETQRSDTTVSTETNKTRRIIRLMCTMGSLEIELLSGVLNQWSPNFLRPQTGLMSGYIFKNQPVHGWRWLVIFLSFRFSENLFFK